MFKQLLVLLLLASTTAQAEIPDWLAKAYKVPEPQFLPLMTNVTPECKAMDADEVLHIAESVFLGTKVKSVLSVNHIYDQSRFPFFLKLVLHCKGKSPYLFHLEVEFSRSMPLPPRSIDMRYGTYGSEDANGIQRAIKTSVRDALDEYITANFKLN